MTETATTKTRTTVGPYTLVNLLGQGGMGVVHLAEHVETGERVALKTLTGVSPELVRGLRREIRALKRLRHPHIVRILDDGITEDGIPWYAMEFLVGVPLDQVIHEGMTKLDRPDPANVDTRSTSPPKQMDWVTSAWTARLGDELESGLVGETLERAGFDTTQSVDITLDLPVSSGEAPQRSLRRVDGQVVALLQYIHQIAHALAYLHGEGLVHCDLKPQNIVITREGRAVLVDFGLVASRGKATQLLDVEEAGLAAGTALYLAPERILGQDFDARLDLYALGCMIFEAVAGRPAFLRPTVSQTLVAHVSGEIPNLMQYADGVPSALVELTDALLQKRPNQRPSHAIWASSGLKQAGIGASIEDLPIVRPHLYAASLVGREDLLERCTEALMASQRKATFLVPEATFLVLRGVSGVGKSRLASEVVRRARTAGFEVLVGQCAPSHSRVGGDHGVPGMGAFTRVLETIAQRAIAEGRETAQRWFGTHGKVLAPYVPSVRNLPGFEECPDLVELPPDDARLRVFSAVYDVLESYLESRSVLIIVEDLQWADDLFLGVLRYLRRRIDRYPVLLLATVRSEEIVERLEPLLGEERVDVLDVDRLSSDLSERMLHSMLGSTDVPQGLVDFVLRHAAGNPFFVVSCVHAAVDTGHLRLDEEGEWLFEEVERLRDSPMPTRLTGLVKKRLELLDEDSHHLVQAASVVGREVNVGFLSRMVEVDDFEGALEDLRARNILEPVEEGAGATHRFVHDKLAEIAYSSLQEEPQNCISLHRRVIQLLEGEEGSHLARLAWHLEKVGRNDDARRTYFKAFRQAVSRFGYREAEEHLHNGLRLSEAEDAASLAAKLYFADEVLSTQGRMAEAEQWLNDVLVRTTGVFEEEHAAALVSLGDLYFRTGRSVEALATLENARALLVEREDREFEARVIGNIGNVHAAQGRFEQALAHYDRTIAIARKIGSRRSEGLGLGHRGDVYREQGRLGEALEHYRVALEIAREVRDRRNAGIWLGNMGIVHLEQGRHREAMLHYRESLQIARDIGDRAVESVMLGNLGDVHLEQGRAEEALGYYEKALAIAREVGERQFEGKSLGGIHFVHKHYGRYREALEQCEVGLAIAREVGDLRFEGYWLTYSGRIHRLSGNLDSARHCQEAALVLLRELGVKDALGECLCEWGHLKLHAGNPADAEMSESREIALELSVGPTSDLGKAVGLLQRAVQAHDRGETLFYGQCFEDFPQAVQKQLTGDL